MKRLDLVPKSEREYCVFLCAIMSEEKSFVFTLAIRVIVKLKSH